MNEVIVGVRVIKMYAWEYAFKRVVKTLRRYGLTYMFKSRVGSDLFRSPNILTFIFLAKVITFIDKCVWGGGGGEL